MIKEAVSQGAAKGCNATSSRLYTLTQIAMRQRVLFSCFKDQITNVRYSHNGGVEDGFVRVHQFDETYFKARPYGDFEPEE